MFRCAHRLWHHGLRVLVESQHLGKGAIEISPSRDTHYYHRQQVRHAEQTDPPWRGREVGIFSSYSKLGMLWEWEVSISRQARRPATACKRYSGSSPKRSSNVRKTRRSRNPRWRRTCAEHSTWAAWATSNQMPIWEGDLGWAVCASRDKRNKTGRQWLSKKRKTKEAVVEKWISRKNSH